MRKRLLITALAMSALFCMSPGRPALAATYTCQTSAGYTAVYTSYDFLVGVEPYSASAEWVVTTKNSTAFSSGVGTVYYSPAVCTCVYSLNTATSSFANSNGTVNQTLNWVLNSSKSNCEGDCDLSYTDDVFALGTLFADSNAGDEDSGSAGTCVVQ